MRSFIIHFFILLSLYVPTVASAVTPMVAAGGTHTAALKSDGTVRAWGLNAQGALGDGTTTNRLSPVVSSGVTGAVAVAAGNQHTVALKSDGTMMAWGWNGHGQLGDGTTTNQLSPVIVPAVTGVAAVAAGYAHTVAHKSDGTVLTWGWNGYGQLGDGTLTSSFNPVTVTGLVGVVAVAAGLEHTVALKSDGTVVAWGRNDYGQLGDGSTTNSPSPMTVTGLTGVIAIAAGATHTVALKSDGTVVTWGSNIYGELGDGTTTQMLTPVPVPGLTNITKVAAGNKYTAVLKSDGTVMTWGGNAWGQLGDGSAINRLSPVTVSGLAGVMAITSGENHSAALKADETIMTWGYNAYGQLGDGTTTNRSNRVGVIGFGVTVPGAPVMGSASAGDAQVTVTFTPPASNGGAAITSYTVTSNPGGITRNCAASPCTVTGLTNGTFYTFTVTATNNAGESPASTQSNGVTPLPRPPTPTGLTVTYNTPGINNLNWTISNDTYVTQYRIYTGSDVVCLAIGCPPSTLSLVATPNGSPPPTSYIHNGATNERYSLAACNELGNCSARSAGATPTPAETTPPTMPTGLSVTPISPSQINLTWSASTDNVGVTSYKVYRNGLLISTLGNVLSYNNTGLASSTTYSYAVQACDAATNCSAQSATTSATTPAGFIDLEMTALSTAATSADVGSNISVSNTVTNLGNVGSYSTSVKFYLSVDMTITASDTAMTASRVVPNLTPGQSNAASTLVTIPTATPPGFYYIGACVNEANALYESSAANNCRAAEMIRVIRDVDWVVTEVSTTATSVNVGSSLGIYNTVVNQGTTAMDVSSPMVNFYLSADNVISTSDIGLIGVRRLLTGPIVPGNTSSETTIVTVPKTTPSGIYYIGAIVDASNLVIESNENNNWLAGNTIVVIRNVDLVMSAVSSAATSVHVGNSFVIANTETNQGTTAMTVPSNTINFYLSADNTITSGDYVLTGTRSVSALAAGASSAGSTTVTAPKTTPPGTYYIGAMADATNLQGETNETNNGLAGMTITVIREVDLVTTGITIIDLSGGNITLGYSVANQGITAMTAANVQLAFYLSLDDIITSSDIKLRSVTIPPYTGTVTLPIPKTTPPGTYYVGGCADSTNVQPETNETNNCLAGGTITVIRNVDLVMTAVSTAAISAPIGTSFVIANTEANQGTTAMTATNNTIKFYLSVDSIITAADMVLTGSRVVSALAAGASSTGSTTVTVPKTTPPGIYYIGAIADATNMQVETNENNNGLAGNTIEVIRDVDLVMTAVSSTATSVNIGETFVIANTEQNQGTTMMSATTNTVKFYLSVDSTITTADMALTGSRVVSGLGVGASSTGSTTVTVPKATPPGTYFIGAIADATNAQPESNETNNWLAGNTITVIRDVDLIMAAVSTTATSVARETAFPITNTETNQGTTWMSAPSNTIKLYLSTDATITTSDWPLTGSRVVAALAPGASNTGTINVTVPLTTPAGTYYIGAIADAMNAQPESIETNNGLAGTTIVIP